MAEVNILGTTYRIDVVKYDDDKIFERDSCSGYCEIYRHRIVLCDLNTLDDTKELPEEARDRAMRRTLRHEIVHAFLLESGLCDNGLVFASSWAANEEMVDWIAIQGPKLYEAWKSADALDDKRMCDRE